MAYQFSKRVVIQDILEKSITFIKTIDAIEFICLQTLSHLLTQIGTVHRKSKLKNFSK